MRKICIGVEVKGRDGLTGKSYLTAEQNYPSEHTFYSESMNINLNYEIDMVSKWYETIDSMEFQFDLSNSLSPLIEIERSLESNYRYKTLKIFEEAVNTYLKEKRENKIFQEISTKALKNFLYILPTIEKYSPTLSIDSDTGYINSTFTTKEHGILRALSTDKGEIHFSRVSEDIRIYKISGVFKVKNSRDFRNFEKVLRML